MDDRDNNGPKQQKRKSTNLLTGVINFAPKVNLRKHNLGCVFMKFNFLDSFFFPSKRRVSADDDKSKVIHSYPVSSKPKSHFLSLQNILP